SGERIAGPDLKSSSEEVVSFLMKSKESAVIRGVQPSALAYLISMAMRQIRKPFVLVAPTDREAERFTEMIRLFAGKGQVENGGEPLRRGVWFLPSRTGHKAQALGKAETTARRVEALYALRAAPSPLVVVTSALALIERLIPPEILIANMDHKIAGESAD